MTKNLINPFLIALFIGITAISFSQKTEKYTSVEGKFTATFQTDGSKLEETKELNEKYKTVKIQTLNNGTIFFIAYTIHEIELVDPEDLASVSVNSFIEGIEGEVVESNTWIINKHSGLKTTFKTLSTNLVGEYRVVIIGQIQYQIAVVAEADAWNQKTADHLFKSFKIKK